MNSASQPNDNQLDQQAISLFRFNRRVLEIILRKKMISKSQFDELMVLLERDVRKGHQEPVEPLLSSRHLITEQQITKELFRYNQIIMKLAHQFLKNTARQDLDLDEDSTESSMKSIEVLNRRFAELLDQITNDYINGFQKNIDDVLLETGLIEVSQLEFLHNGANHLEIKSLDRKFGEIAVKNQFATKDMINRALSEQTELYRKTSKNHIIGDLLVKKREMTSEIRDEILLIQNRVMEEDWEDTLKRIGQSAIEEQEKNALFGALVIKENLLKPEQVVEALRIQNSEKELFEKEQNDTGKPDDPPRKKRKHPRWLGDILVEDFGLSESDRKRIIQKQMQHKIEMINLKFGINLKDAHRELFHELDTFFQLSYSKNRLRAYITLKKEIPSSMTKNNIVLWLYHKKISYGRINSAVQKLLNRTVKPGDTITIAKGDEPVPESLSPIFHFSMEDASNKTDGFPVIISKGTRLVTIQRSPGKSGLNVNHCFVSSPPLDAYPVLRGNNIIKTNGDFLAGCDGALHFSDTNLLSINPVVTIRRDITGDCPPINHNCDVVVRGTVESDVVIKCRKLTVKTLKGRVFSSDDVMIEEAMIDSEIISRGDITLAATQNSTVTGERNIIVQAGRAKDGPYGNSVSNSILSCNDVCTITDASLSSTIVRARTKIILRKSSVESDCKFIVGESNAILNCKKEIEKIDTSIRQCNHDIQVFQNESQELFNKMEKKDISDIEEKIRQLNTLPTKTKDALDRLRELNKTKREKEREFEKKYNDYADLFINASQQINIAKKQISDLEKEKLKFGDKLLALYAEEKEIPELDARRATLPKGTVIQFRHTRGTLDSDCEGFVFREEFSESLQKYEIKKHRW